MKTIEERANAAWSDYEYREGELYSTCFIDGFSAGAQSERDELTRWRDPKEELPPVGKIVLVKIIFGSGYTLAKRGDEGWWYVDSEEWAMSDKQVIGWLPIYENKQDALCIFTSQEYP